MAPSNETMFSVRNGLMLTALLGAAAMSGCAARAHYARVAPPPPPMVGVVGHAPGRGYVWIEGFYEPRGSRWAWTPGRWVRPPHRRAVWVRPRYQRERDRYHYYPGYWR
jgi:hypothetical protein